METVNTKATLEAMAKYICEANNSKPDKDKTPLFLIIGDNVTVDGKEALAPTVLFSGGEKERAAFLEGMLRTYMEGYQRNGMPRKLAEMLVLRMVAKVAANVVGIELPDLDFDEEEE